MTDKPCPFCGIVESRTETLKESALSAAFYDAFPSRKGHILVVPKRHVGKMALLSHTELLDLFSLVQVITDEKWPQDWTIGINDGPLAGQTVPHLHVHLIPREEGDWGDPRGGIRWLFPETANYWD